jgi:hypothetical protein
MKLIRSSFVAIPICCLFAGAAVAQTAAPSATAPPPALSEEAAPHPSGVPPADAASAPSAGPASAAAPASTTPEAIYVAQPPLPPLEPRSRHYHDGFYLRLSVGFGALGVSSSGGQGFGSTASGSGGALDFLVGGTPAPGLVLGGGVLLQEAFNPNYSAHFNVGALTIGDTSTGSGSLGFGMLGPMIDAFPNPSGGFHVGGLVGVSRIGLNDGQGNPSTGIGLSAWVGYMWWASSQWSLGGLVRLSGARSGRKLGNDPNQFDVTDTTRAITFMFSTAYH